MREQLAAASRTEGEDDDGDWAIPEDRFSPEALDPWMLGLDEVLTDEEQPFQYPAGLP